MNLLRESERARSWHLCRDSYTLGDWITEVVAVSGEKYVIALPLFVDAAPIWCVWAGNLVF